jgi:hypothetical protein
VLAEALKSAGTVHGDESADVRVMTVSGMTSLD